MLIFTPFATMESESFVNNSDLHHFGSFVGWSPARQARAQKQQQQVRPLTPFPPFDTLKIFVTIMFKLDYKFKQN